MFYGYKSEEGLTKQIYTKLSEDMTYPEEYLPRPYQTLGLEISFYSFQQNFLK